MSDLWVHGIDLGTTFSACARAITGSTRVDSVPVDVGQRQTLASAVFLSPRQGAIRAYVGFNAEEQANDDRSEGKLVEFSKRYIGLSGEETRSWSVASKTFDPEDIASLILRKIRKMVEEFSPDAPIQHAVVTHPRDFTLPRKEATHRAIKLARLNAIDTINEPEAAAHMFFAPGGDRDPGVYVVFDLGGGTLDIAVLEVPEEGRIKVIGGHGVSALGGKDWDAALESLMFEQAAERHAVDNIEYQSEITRGTAWEIRKLARQWKHESGTRERWKQRLLSTLSDGRQVFTPLLIDVSSWEARCKPLVDRCDHAVVQALIDANVHERDVKRVLPVGGSVRLRMVQERLRTRFGDKVEPIDRMNPDHAIAQGAARYGSYEMMRTLAKTSVEVRKSAMLMLIEDSGVDTSLPHGICVRAVKEKKPGAFEPYLAELVPKGAALPAKASQSFRVVDPGAELTVEIFEGKAGLLPDGVRPSGLLVFPPSVNARKGDEVRVEVRVGQSGRVEVSAVHGPSGHDLQVELRSGAGAGKEDLGKKLSLLESVEVV